MKRLIVIAGIGLALAGCSSDENTDFTGTAPGAESGSVMTNNNAVPNAAGSTTPIQSESATPSSPERAATTTSSGETAPQPVGTPGDKGSGENQNLDGQPVPPAGTGVENGSVNTNAVGNAGSSTPQNAGSTR